MRLLATLQERQDFFFLRTGFIVILQAFDNLSCHAVRSAVSPHLWLASAAVCRRLFDNEIALIFGIWLYTTLRFPRSLLHRASHHGLVIIQSQALSLDSFNCRFVFYLVSILLQWKSQSHDPRPRSGPPSSSWNRCAS